MFSKAESQFVLIASFVGIIYSLVIVFITKAIGSQTAGMAGIGLTAIAAGFCGKYNDLFTTTTKLDTGQFATCRGIWLILVLAISFQGIQVIVGYIYGCLEIIFPKIPSLAGPNRNLVFAVALVAGTYLLGGLLATFAFPNMVFSNLVWAALVTYVMSFVIGALPQVIKREWQRVFHAFSLLQAVCLLYVGVAILPLVLKGLIQSKQVGPQLTAKAGAH